MTIVTTRTGTFSELRDKLASTLAAVQKLGVTWSGTRFHKYLEACEREIARESRRIYVPNDRPDAAYVDLLWESVSQSRQLIHSAAVWPHLDEETLRRKLQIVFQGKAVQERGVETDGPRNILLELLTARFLYDDGFDVAIAEHGADVTATIADFPAFAVECKRPASAKTLPKNIKAMREQIRRRLAEGYKHAIPVFGVDRVLPVFSDPLPTAISVEHANDAVTKAMNAYCAHMQRLVMQFRFSPRTTPVGAIVLVGAFLVLSPHAIHTVERIRLFGIAGVEDVRLTRIQELSSK